MVMVNYEPPIQFPGFQFENIVTKYQRVVTKICDLAKPYNRPESTKQMEQTLRAKIKIFFKSENFKKNAFNKK